MVFQNTWKNASFFCDLQIQNFLQVLFFSSKIQIFLQGLFSIGAMEVIRSRFFFETSLQNLWNFVWFQQHHFLFSHKSLEQKTSRIFFSQFFYGEPRFGMILSLRCHSTKFVNFPILATLFVWQTQEFVKFCMNAFFFQNSCNFGFLTTKFGYDICFFPRETKLASVLFLLIFVAKLRTPGKKANVIHENLVIFFFFAKISDIFAVWFYFFLHPFGGSSSQNLIWQFFSQSEVVVFESVFQALRSWMCTCIYFMFHFLWPSCERTFFPVRCKRWKNVPFSLASVCSNLIEGC